MEDKGKGNIGRTAWDVLYDFLTEIFAMLIPGGFFISYFVFAVLLGMICISNQLEISTHIVTASVMGIFGLMIVAISYCFGAIFQRREIKNTDQKSARWIYKKNAHNNGNSFAFANALDEQYVKRIYYILKYHIYKAADNDFDIDREGLKPKLAGEISDILKKLGGIDVLKETARSYLGLEDIEEDAVDELIKDCRNSNKETPFLQELAITVISKLLAEKKDNSSESDDMQELAVTVSSKLLAEKNDNSSESDDNAHSISRKYKLLLAYLDEKTQRTLKEKLENIVWDEIETACSKKEEEKGNKKIDIHKKIIKILDTMKKGPKAFKNLKEENKKNKEKKEKEKGNKKIDRYIKMMKILDMMKKGPKVLPGKNSRYTALERFLKRINRITKKNNDESTLKKSKKELGLWYTLEKVQKLIDGDLYGDIECPYKRMYQYCYDRGLEFAGIVDWGDGVAARDDYVYVIDTLGLTTDDSIEVECNRSKIRLNTDKLQISLNNPKLARTLEKNEAHIRFNNSIYYASRLLLTVIAFFSALVIGIGILSFIGTGITVIDSFAVMGETNLMLYLIGLNFVYFIACFYIGYSTKETMNYQRVREVTMLLKAKYLVELKKEQADSL